MNTRRAALAGVACALVIGGGVTLARLGAADPEPAAGGPPSCALSTLPPEASDTVRAIHHDGPFPFPHNDGVVFGNREGHLPPQARGFYHEYTVITPGSRNRSVRRIVTGGSPLTDPPQFYYTGDHYESFCLVSDANGRS